MKNFRGVIGCASFAILAACSQGVPDSGQYGRQYEQALEQKKLDDAARAQAAAERAAAEQAAADQAAIELGATGGVMDARGAEATAAVPPVTSAPIPVEPVPVVTYPVATAPVAPAAPAPQPTTTQIVAAPTYAVTNGGQQAPRDVIEASPTNAAPVIVSNPGGLSDENDFDAVSSRETIESDAERLARNAAQYEVVSPTALPTRSGSSGPSIIEYALSAPNRVGQPWYSRLIFASESRAARACAKYSSPDEAQEDFLRRGGPEQNPSGLDPDGDGFVCGWDPAPFRAAVQSARTGN